jgi:hypothetical protein
MKRNSFFILIGIALFAIMALAFSAPQGEDNVGTMYRPTVKTATITNTGADTTLIPSNLFSLWSYSYTGSLTQTSGTSSVILILEGSNETTGNVWFEVARDTISAATGGLTKNLTGEVLCVRHRVRATGVGTHVSAYRLSSVFKKKN